MAHEITQTDGLVLHKERAWHGLGTVVEQAPTPEEALKLAGLDWSVHQTDDVRGYANGLPVRTDKWRLNVRSDVQEVLGCVSDNYQPIQNSDVAQFCEQLSMDTVVKVESAGSLFGGKKIWFLLKADTFDVGRNGSEDPVVPYVLVSNGHDGSLAFSALPTSVRVVCNNTLSWALNRRKAVFSLRHTGTILSRVDEARKRLEAYMGGLDEFKDKCQHLRNKPVSREEIECFFFNMYQKCVGQIPTTYPNMSDEDHNKRQKAYDSISDMCQNFDEERSIAGTTYWNAFNASSRWLQNRTNNRSEDAVLYNKVMGAASDNTTKAFNLALSYA
jgi:phage/plasmid-like protein (TIGR03299 family)